MSETKEMVSFLEDTDIIKQIDAVAIREGSNRSAILRRAIRKELSFLSSVPTSGINPAHNNVVVKEQS